MSTANPLLTKRYLAGANIFKYRIVKFGSNDDDVIQAAAATDKLIGITGADDGALDASPMVEDNDQVDVHHSGIALCKLGGTVTRGDQITSDAVGRGVATTTGGNRYIGTALASGVFRDVIPVMISPGLI